MRNREARLAGLSDQLAAATAKLADLEAAEPRLAHEAATGSDDKARDRYRAARRQMEGTREMIALLEKAILHEREQSARKAQARKRAEQDAIKARAIKKAQGRIELFRQLSAELAAAVATYQKVINATTEIVASAPIHSPIRAGLMLHSQELRLAVTSEIARLEGISVITDADMQRTFPRLGGIGLAALANPKSITPLVDAGAEALAAFEKEMDSSPVFPAAAEVVPPSRGEAKPAALIVNDQAAGQPFTSPEIGPRIAALLQRQSELANDLSHDGEQAYAAVVSEIAAITGENRS